MATIKIKGDTKDAQNKIKTLVKELENLDKKSQKPIKPKVQASRGISGGGSNYSQTGALLGGMRASSFKKPSLGGLNMASLGTLGGSIMGGLAGAAAGFALGAVADVTKQIMDKLGLSALRAATGISAVGTKFEKLSRAIEVFEEPQKEALSRADQIDALDDERRSHNTKTNAEEFGWSRAFANIGGQNGQPVADRLQSYIEMATSGNISEMDKAWKGLSKMGITWDDLDKGNTWEVFAKMLKSYDEAGKDGVNELEPVFQQIFGKRQMGVIRKMGDGSELTSQAALLRGEYDKVISPIEGKILDAAAQSEIIRSQAEIHNMAIPESGVKFITEGAQFQLDSAKLSEEMLAANGSEVFSKLYNEIKKEFDTPSSGKGVTDNKVLNWLTNPDIQGLRDANANAFESIRQSNDKLLESSLNFADAASKMGGKYNGLFTWNHKMLPNGTEQYTSFDPIGQTLKGLSHLVHGATDLGSNVAERKIDAPLQAVQYAKDLVNRLRDNTEATKNLNNTIQQKASAPSSNNSNNNTGSFFQ